LLLDGRYVDFFLNFIIDSFKNTMQAFIWPVIFMQFAPPWGFVGLGILFTLFPIFVKHRIEAWLFADEELAKGAEIE
jgi:hypothetical protein